MKVIVRLACVAVAVMASGCATLADLFTDDAVRAAAAIPAHPSHAPSGTQFAKDLEGMPMEARERAVLAELRRGNMPSFLRRLKPVTLTSRDPQGNSHVGTVWVMPDYLAVGTDGDFLRVPMNPMTAQRVADHFGFVLPTKKLVDEVYRQADRRLNPDPLPPGDRMGSINYYQRHNSMIERQVGGMHGTLMAGQKKDIVLTNRLQEIHNRVAIYGWHRDQTNPIQPLSIVHAHTYADYSHGVRLVYGMMKVDGDWKPVAEVMQDPLLAPLLSDEGMIRLTRIATDCM